MPNPSKLDLVYGALRRARRKGLTIKQAADACGVSTLTARRHLRDLVSQGRAVVSGQAQTGLRGRPALIYAMA